MIGFIANDEIVLDSGVKVTGSFHTIGRSTLKVQMQENGLFVLVCIVTVYKDLDSKNTQLAAIKQTAVSIPNITYEQMSQSNPYEVVYNYLKQSYNDTVDVNIF